MSEPRFDECLDCRFYHERRVHRNCLRCGAGEFFEEEIKEEEVTDDDLFDMLKDWDNDDAE